MGLADAFGANGLQGRRISPPSQSRHGSLIESQDDPPVSDMSPLHPVSLDQPKLQHLISPQTHKRRSLTSESQTLYPHSFHCTYRQIPEDVQTRPQETIRRVFCDYPPQTIPYRHDQARFQAPQTACRPPTIIHSVSPQQIYPPLLRQETQPFLGVQPSRPHFDSWSLRRIDESDRGDTEERRRHEMETRRVEMEETARRQEWQARWRLANEKEFEQQRERSQRHDILVEEIEAQRLAETRRLQETRQRRDNETDRSLKQCPLLEMVKLRHGSEQGVIIGRPRHEALTIGSVVLPSVGSSSRRKQSVPTSFAESTGSGGPYTSGSDGPCSREIQAARTSGSMMDGVCTRRCETAQTARPPQEEFRDKMIAAGPSMVHPFRCPSILTQPLTSTSLFQPLVTHGPNRFSIKRGIHDHTQQTPENPLLLPTRERRLSSVPMIPKVTHRAQHSALSMHTSSSTTSSQQPPSSWSSLHSPAPPLPPIAPRSLLATVPIFSPQETCVGCPPPCSPASGQLTPRQPSRFTKLPSTTPLIPVWSCQSQSVESEVSKPVRAVGGARMFSSVNGDSIAPRICRRPRQPPGPLELSRSPSVPSLTRTLPPPTLTESLIAPLSRQRDGNSHRASTKVSSSPKTIPTPSTGASGAASIDQDDALAPSGLAAHMMAMQEAEALLAGSVLPPFPAVSLEEEAPTATEFLQALLVSQSFDVGVADNQRANIFAESRNQLVQEREAEFKKGFDAGWPPDILSQIKSASLFSQATLHQTSDTRETSWFPDADGGKQNVQSQLLSHVYNSAQTRDIFGNYFSAGSQGLDPSLDVPKFVEKRRIQNSLRRFLELAVESFIVDVCVAGVDELEKTNLNMPMSEWRRMVDWLISHPSSLLPVLQGLWAVIKDADDSGEEETGATTFAQTLTKLDWLPPELIEMDAVELAEAISLSTSSKQLDFALQRDFSGSISEWNFVLCLASLPANLPDFPLGDKPNLKSGQDVNALLREVVSTASKLCDIILTESTSRAESTLCHEKLRRSAHWSQNQLALGGRHHVFVAQDFLVSGLVSLEELQWLVALNGCNGDLVQPFSAEILKSVVDEFRKDAQPTIPSIRVVELAVELMLAASFYNLTSSEKYSARNPWSALAVDIKVSEVVSRFADCPFPVPLSANLLPYTQRKTQTIVSSPSLQISAYTPHESIQLDQQRQEKGESLSGSEDLISDDAAKTISGHTADLDGDEECERLDIDEDLRVVFVLLHAGETLQEILRLSQGTSKNKQASLQVALKDERLRAQDEDAWRCFWVQGLEMISRIESTCQCGTWGPIRWTALKQMATLYRALDAERLIVG